MDLYLKSSQMIDWQQPTVLAKASTLAQGCLTDEAIAKACFEFVRDEIKHSGDYRLNPVTCRASQVLEHKTGYCYAKSHLLAALLRANGIPAGLCYQRLTIDGLQAPFCLHGLNAVYLHGAWYRMDARGNKEGVVAEFTPPKECLAFPIVVEGERDLAGVYAEPLDEVVAVLSNSTTFQAVLDCLPDVGSDVR